MENTITAATTTNDSNGDVNDHVEAKHVYVLLTDRFVLFYFSFTNFG